MRKHILVVGLIVVTMAASSQVRRDPRPLQGLKKELLPAAKSMQEIAKQSIPGGLLQSAKYVGKANRQQLEITDHGTLERANQNGKSSTLWKVLRSTNGSVNWMWRMGNATASEKPQAVKPPISILSDLKIILRIADPEKEFLLESDSRDELGMRHLRFVQIYSGIPVWKRDLYVHLDKNGEPSIVNGTYELTPSNVSVTPLVAADKAVSITHGDLQSLGRMAQIDPEARRTLGLQDAAATLVLFPEQGAMRLAYDVDVYPNLTEHYRYIIDASNGQIIRRTPLHCSITGTSSVAGPISVSGFDVASESLGKSFMPLAGFTNSSGVDLRGTNRNFRSYQHTDNLFYMVWDLANYNAGASTPPNELQGGGQTLDLKNKDASSSAQLFHITASNNNWTDPSAVSAHANMSVCYDYYRNTFTRNAIDGKNGTIISIIHVTENNQSMGNAYWNGKLMLYGDGDNNFKPLAGALDVAGHEMTHGVTGNSADLIYEFQSGALNESFSDVFGVMIDNNNLTVGEDIIQPGKGTCLRNLENPADPNALSPQPGHMDQFKNLSINQDNGGVHINSGIPNHAAAIIINALGRQKAEQIYYKALTNFLTRNSQFIDCRIACESAAQELFGVGSPENQTVSNAFAAVGIGGSSPGDGGNDVPPQTGGSDFITFIAATNQIGYLKPSTGEAFLFSDQFAVARVTPVNGNMDRCQLSAPRSGNNIWFVDPNGHLAFIESATGKVFNFPNLAIQQNGDVWNASVSPDEAYVSIVSSYVNDPNIYIFDGQNLTPIKLMPQTPDGGAQETIQYPDVMSWSPNKFDKRIAFDAYNEEDLAFGGSIAYWSMYEINFTTGKIFSLIPSQPEGVDIGNVTYSKTNPDLIAFNVIDQSGADIWIGKFEDGEIFPLGIPNVSINSVPLTDADRPSFSPNDQFICFTSAANNAICYFEGGTGKVTFTAYTQPLFNPHWFLVGGSADVARDQGHYFDRVSVFPTVTSSDASLRFSIEKPGDVTIEIVNMTGVTVKRIAAGTLAAGDHEVALDLTKLVAGVYFVQLKGGTHQASTKLVIE